VVELGQVEALGLGVTASMVLNVTHGHFSGTFTKIAIPDTADRLSDRLERAGRALRIPTIIAAFWVRAQGQHLPGPICRVGEYSRNHANARMENASRFWLCA
jgi:hypothetical protein